MAQWFVTSLGISLSALTLGSLLGRFHWLLDVLSHFHLQYAALLGLCLIVGLLLQAKTLVLLLLPALLANLVLLAPFFLPHFASTATAESAPNQTLSVMALNVYRDNRNYNAIVSYLRAEHTDVVMLSEIQPNLMRTLQASLRDLYPHSYDASTPGTYGLAFLSRYPLLEAQSVPLGGRRRRVIEATLVWQTPVTLFGAHPLPPLGSRWAQRRNDELVTLEALVQQATNPVILLGDFNASPWSFALQQLSKTTALRFANLGLGIRSTWFYGPIGAPLDHVLVSAQWRVTRYEVGREVGSDHLPIVAELALP